MRTFRSSSLFLTIFMLLFFADSGLSCSMYKITMNGITMVGSNYDAYYLTLRIWFETGTQAGDYGAVFTGGRYDGNNGFAPQSGMNEFGLTFSSLDVPTPGTLLVATNKKLISNPTHYVKDILHKCKTIDEVKDYISEYDYGYFSHSLFIYIDKSGRYLIVEPDTMIIGNESNYVLSNFCPSQTPDLSTIKQARYIKGMAFLKNKTDTSIGFCTAMSDTMHVCREKIGDGTLLTSIRDLNAGIIYLNFYHDYKHQVKFNLKEEMTKGNHFYEVPALFPPNAEYENLRSFRTPQNTSSIMAFMLMSAGLFLFSALFFLISFFRKRDSTGYSYLKLILFTVSILMFYYVLVLARNENIFYFPAPYKDYKFSMLNVAAYIPFLILLLIIPFFIANRKLFRENVWNRFSKWLFTLNNVAYLALLILFAYWGLFDIFR